MGSRKTHTVPSTSAAARQVRSIAAASSGWLGTATHQPRDVAQHRDRVVVVEVAAEPLLVGEPGDAHDHRVVVLRRRRRTAGSPPRRAAGPRRCAGRRGTGSRGWAAARRAPTPSARPRMVCSSSSVSNTRAAPNRFAQPAGHAVDAALAADVLAEDQRLGCAASDVGQGRVDRLRQRQRALVLGQLAAEELPRALGGGPRAAPTGPASRRRERRHRPGRACASVGTPVASAASADHLAALPRSARAPRRASGRRRRRAAGPWRAAGRARRSAAISRGRPVGRSRRPSPAWPISRTVRRCRSAGRRCAAHVGRRARGAAGGRQVAAVGLRVLSPGRPGAARRPSRRRRDADADAVVLADEQQRQRQPLVGAVGRGVERAGRGGVVGGRVPEAAHHDRVARPGAAAPELARPAAERERHADARGQVGGDRRGLRDDVRGRG